MKEIARYTKLAEITQLVNSKLNLRESLEQVVIAISEEILQCDSVGIYLSQADGTFRGYVGKPQTISGVTLDQLVVDPQTDMLAKEIIETRKSIYIPDTSMDSRPDPRPIQMFNIVSLLGVPIYYEEELFGLVFLFIYGRPMNLSNEEIQTVEAYVNMAAVAIRNAKMFAHMEELLAEKQILIDATRELSSGITTQEILATCFRYVGQVLNSPDIGVHLRDRVNGKYLLPASLSKDSEWQEEEWRRLNLQMKIDLDKDLLYGEVVREKKTILIPDISADPRPSQRACRTFGVNSIFIIPLVALGEVFGTVSIVSLGQVRTYPAGKIELAQSIVDATATALSNVIRQEELQSRVDRLYILGKLAATISHEVRNPLTAVRGFIQILEEKASSGFEEYYQIILAELDRANEIISDFLSMANNRQTEYKECNLNKLIEDLAPILTADAQIKGQALAINLEEQLPNCFLNEKEIKQVILNIVKNATEAMGPYGNVAITTKKINGCIELLISDTGCGIANEKVDILFEPFYTTKENGTGLGLSVCKNIINNHGGSIRVETEKGTGTTFIIVLKTKKNGQP